MNFKNPSEHTHNSPALPAPLLFLIDLMVVSVFMTFKIGYQENFYDYHMDDEVVETSVVTSMPVTDQPFKTQEPGQIDQ